MVRSILNPTMATDTRPPFWDKLWAGILTVVLAAVSALFANSYANGTRDNEAKATQLRLDRLETNSVTKDQFNEFKDTVKEIRDNQKETRDDVKRILQQQNGRQR